MSITYQNRTVAKIGEVIDVFLEGKKVGVIMRVVGGYQFQSTSKKHVGEVMETVSAVKNSLWD